MLEFACFVKLNLFIYTIVRVSLFHDSTDSTAAPPIDRQHPCDSMIVSKLMSPNWNNMFVILLYFVKTKEHFNAFMIACFLAVGLIAASICTTKQHHKDKYNKHETT